MNLLDAVIMISSDPRGLALAALVGLAVGLLLWAIVDLVVTVVPTFGDYLERGGVRALLFEARAVLAAAVFAIATWFGLASWVSARAETAAAPQLVTVELAPKGSGR